MRLVGLERTRGTLIFGWGILIAAWMMVLPLSCMAMSTAGAWDQAASELAGQIAGVLGPGQARLSIRNLSSIANDDIPSIRALLEQGLKAQGITLAKDESANAVRVTLSENQRERLWVAEVVEGSETRVVMVRLAIEARTAPVATSGITLHAEELIAGRAPVLAALDAFGALVTVEPEHLVFYAHAADGWHEEKRASIRRKRAMPRDPRALLRMNGETVEAWLPGEQCAARFAGQWTVDCHESDDPWPIGSAEAPAGIPGTSPGGVSLKAFYNATRNYFTGVVAPAPGVDLPPFYSAAEIPRALGTKALLFNGLDGRLLMAESGALRIVSGAENWGSDFAPLNSGCGPGMQIVASGSGEAASDSLRAYELPSQEAIPAGAPLAMNGTVLAVGETSDRKSVFATIGRAAEPGQPDRYEVVRVTATCH